MTSRPPVLPLDYEPERPGPRPWFILLLVAVGLLTAVAALFVFFARTTTTISGVVVVTAVPAPAEPPPSRFVPAEGISVILEQRDLVRVADERLTLSIGDITGGQVRVSLADEEGNWLLREMSLAEGEHIDFPDPEGAPLRLTLVRLSNVLIGEDEAEILIAPPQDPATRPASAPAQLSEAQKIDMLLERVAASEGTVFLRNGDEHSAPKAADHLRMKWEQAGGPNNPNATAEDFIEQVGSRSSLSGREYRVRLPDGRELPSAQWLRAELREIEGRFERADTRPATRAANSRLEASHAVSANAILGRTRSDALMNLALPTLGGKQLWTDVRIDPSGWRIQRNAVTGHYRLLNHRDRRLAWGTARECEQAWERQAPASDAAQRGDRELVVLLHGLFRTRSAMQPMADYLRAEGYHVVNFGYASTRETIERQAQALSSVLSHLAGYRRVHFVGHSLGSLVVRQWLKTVPDEPDPPIGRVVMLAPPNNGSQLAVRLRRNPVFLLALGTAGQEIAEWSTLEKTLGTPKDFGVIAGDCSLLGNPLLDESGDLVVTLEETRLPGMKDFVCVDATHTFLMRNPEVKRITLSFLRDGSFSRSP